MSNKSKQFSSGKEIDDFFRQFDNGGFVSWFNNNVAGRGDFNGVRIKNPDNWTSVWSNLNILFGKSSVNLVEFLSINTIIINETGGTFIPKSEILGLPGHDGIAYAFDKISGTKLGYNTLGTNKSSFNLFNDPKYKEAHSTKPLGGILKDTTDVRWKGDTFPQGFSGNVKNELNKDGKTNSFLTESDFMKFRGRGFIQSTGRSIYKPLISFILNYSGSNSVINNIRNVWGVFGKDIDTIASISTNQQWDDLFQKTNSIIANYAVYSHSLQGNKYNIIDPNQSNIRLEKSIKNVASKIAGGGATKYIELFYGRVMQQLELVDVTSPEQSGLTQSQPSGVTQSQLSQTDQQDLGREERTGEDPNSGNTNTKQELKTPGVTNIFGPTLYPTPISFDVSTSSKDAQKEFVDGMGYLPFIWYNGAQIDINSVEYFHLYNDGIVPSLKLVFEDVTNLIGDRGFPLDDTKIKVFMNPRSSQLKPILLEFKIKTFSGSEGSYKLGGVLDANQLYIKKFKSYKNMTSHKALQEVSKEIGLGFNSNISNTTDSMTWINTGSRTYEFIDQVVDSSYKSDDSFIISYVDFYYNLNYIDIEKELNRNINNELGVSSFGLEEISKVPDKDKVSRLFITNDETHSSSSYFFKKYKVINNSTSVSLESGYLNKINYYDEVTKDFLVFDIDSITSTGDKSIILKGSPQDETFYNENIDIIYVGKTDSDNSHKNHKYSLVQNNKNIFDLQKIGLEVEMSNPNYNLYRFQKILVVIVNQATTPAAPLINQRLSGEWLVTDIKYTYSDRKFSQILSLVKRELELSPDELSQESPPTSQVKSQTENTTNPEPNIFN